MLEYDRAPFGVIGLETALGLAMTKLHYEQGVPVSRIVEMLTSGPAKAFSLAGGSLAKGAAADVVLFDPGREWTVDPARFRSKSRNTPFGGWKLKGAVVATFVEGREVFRAG
jgi:dihydroorotase